MRYICCQILGIFSFDFANYILNIILCSRNVIYTVIDVLVILISINSAKLILRISTSIFCKETVSPRTECTRNASKATILLVLVLIVNPPFLLAPRRMFFSIVKGLCCPSDDAFLFARPLC